MYQLLVVLTLQYFAFGNHFIFFSWEFIVLFLSSYLLMPLYILFHTNVLSIYDCHINLHYSISICSSTSLLINYAIFQGTPFLFSFPLNLLPWSTHPRHQGATFGHFSSSSISNKCVKKENNASGGLVTHPGTVTWLASY